MQQCVDQLNHSLTTDEDLQMDGQHHQEVTQQLEELKWKLRKAENDLDETQVFLTIAIEVLETVRLDSEEVSQQLEELQWMLHMAQSRFEQLAPKLTASQKVKGALQNELEETKEKLSAVEKNLDLQPQPPVKVLKKLKAKFKVLIKKVGHFITLKYY